MVQRKLKTFYTSTGTALFQVSAAVLAVFPVSLLVVVVVGASEDGLPHPATTPKKINAAIAFFIKNQPLSPYLL